MSPEVVFPRKFGLLRSYKNTLAIFALSIFASGCEVSASAPDWRIFQLEDERYYLGVVSNNPKQINEARGRAEDLMERWGCKIRGRSVVRLSGTPPMKYYNEKLYTLRVRYTADCPNPEKFISN